MLLGPCPRSPFPEALPTEGSRSSPVPGTKGISSPHGVEDPKQKVPVLPCTLLPASHTPFCDATLQQGFKPFFSLGCNKKVAINCYKAVL